MVLFQRFRRVFLLQCGSGWSRLPGEGTGKAGGRRSAGLEAPGKGASILALHNHPGSLHAPMPSESDRMITYKLREVGELLGIRLLDHIVIGEESYFSFKDHYFA
ncbi:MAG: JAB domain-containing protein [Acidobacteriota bacterium]